jgi:hypothetical protein
LLLGPPAAADPILFTTLVPGSSVEQKPRNHSRFVGFAASFRTKVEVNYIVITITTVYLLDTQGKVFHVEHSRRPRLFHVEHFSSNLPRIPKNPQNPTFALRLYIPQILSWLE